MKFIVTAKADFDLAQIWDYIAQDSERAADGVIASLLESFELIGISPRLGRVRSDLRPGYRSFSDGQYLVFYIVADPGVQIIRVIHRRRDLDSVFRDDEG